MKYILPILQCINQTKQSLHRSNYFLFQQIQTIYSKTGIWDQEYPTPEVLKEVETHWKHVFQKQQHQREISSSKKKYILAMFPYPSGQLHMGHVRVYTLSDTLARYYRLLGYQVIHPIGWDAFGLPAENAAIERGVSSVDWTEQNIKQMKEQFTDLGFSFDWWRELRTCSPGYYRWTQELFLMLHRAGLVYRKQAFVNWDPVDQTVLADEQVDLQGRAWRSGAVVERRLLDQWYIRTTRFLQPMYEGLSSPQLEEWRNVIALQRGWIGLCTGCMVDVALLHGPQAVDTASATQGEPNAAVGSSLSLSLSLFTTHPELLHAVSFVGVKTDHSLVCGGYKSAAATGDTSHGSARYPVLNTMIVNPLSQKPIPIIVSNDLPYSHNTAEFYIGYGSGSDFDKSVCKECGFDAVNVLENCDLAEYINRTTIEEVYPENTTTSKSNAKSSVHITNDTIESKCIPPDVNVRLINSGSLSGLLASEARTAVLKTLQAYPSSPNQKDWLISRQRYWGTPIPMVYCPSCGTVPVPSDQLPVTLPTVTEAGAVPLQGNQQWRRCSCPKCGGDADRETDTMDTFVDSAWYFLRYLDPDNCERPFDREVADAGMPVDIYVGGEEHAVRHLYYARFIQHFLHSEKLTKYSEPFIRLLLVGRIKSPAYINADGKYLSKDQVDLTVRPPVDKETRTAVKVIIEKMSKSKHNGVEPSSVIEQYSVDLVRLAVLRGESPGSNRNWQDDSLRPVIKLVTLIWRIVGTFIHERQAASTEAPLTADALTAHLTTLADARNRLVNQATYSYSHCGLNDVIRAVETFTRQLRSAPLPVLKEAEYERALAALLVILSPMIPHICAELWHAFSVQATLQYQDGTIQQQQWPEIDSGFQLPVRFSCWVNDCEVHKCELTGAEAASFSADQTVERLLVQEASVRDSIAGQPILRTDVQKHETGLKIKLSIFTLDEKGLIKKKKRDKENKKSKKLKRDAEQDSKNKVKA